MLPIHPSTLFLLLTQPISATLTGICVSSAALRAGDDFWRSYGFNDLLGRMVIIGIGVKRIGGRNTLNTGMEGICY
jgi:hypothetical protein